MNAVYCQEYETMLSDHFFPKRRIEEEQSREEVDIRQRRQDAEKV